MPFDPQAQRRIMGRFATGVTVVTTRHGDTLGGMTANAVVSLSLEPPLVLVAVDRRAQLHPLLLESKCFAVNILSAAQEQLSRRFATGGPKEFSDLALSESVTGAPILAEALGHVECRLVEVLSGGDHDMFIGEIVAGDSREGRPLLFFAGKYAQLVD